LNVIEKELPSQIEMKLKTSGINMEDGIGDDFVEFVEQGRVKYNLHSMQSRILMLKNSFTFSSF
jgi:hypothetical protein